MNEYNPLYEIVKQYNDEILKCIELLEIIQSELGEDAQAITSLIYTLYNSVVEVKEVAQCQ